VILTNGRYQCAQGTVDEYFILLGIKGKVISTGSINKVTYTNQKTKKLETNCQIPVSFMAKV